MIIGKEVYVHTPDGYGNSKLSGAMLERRLGRGQHDPELEHRDKALRTRRPLTAMDVVGASIGPGRPTGASTRIWSRTSVDGELVALRNGRTRQGVTDDLVALGLETPDGLMAGLDFSFSLPVVVPARRIPAAASTTSGDWRRTGGETGSPSVPRPSGGGPGGPGRRCRGTFAAPSERLSVGGISAKSTFQVGGAGAVGTGSPSVACPTCANCGRRGSASGPSTLRHPGQCSRSTPVSAPGPCTRATSSSERSYLDAAPWALPTAFAASMVGSDDAFDAAISALVMHDHLDDLVCVATNEPIPDPAGGRRVASS